MEPIQPLEQFLNLSLVLTGFNKVELQATGMGRDYLSLLIEMAGDTLCFELGGDPIDLCEACGTPRAVGA